MTDVDADQDRRPVVLVQQGDLHRIADEAELELSRAGLEIYVHGETLQTPVIEEVEASRGRLTKTARFQAIGVDLMRDFMSRTISFQRYDGRSKDYVNCDAPRDVAAVILARPGTWQFPRARGIITNPTLRPDGSLLCETGYDQATRLVVVDPPDVPDVPERPTQRQASDALDALDELLNEFEFVDDASRSVALSALITPVVRGALSVAPLHAVRAPAPGSGKSYLLDVVSAIATGRPCPVITAGKTEEELEKRLGAKLMRGQPIVSIDNLNGDLAGDFLCQLIERPIVEVRPLGSSKIIAIENNGTTFANGNNLQICGDVVRRTIMCSLDAKTERPELRTFRQRPVDVVLADRGMYMACALLVVRSYICAGYPDQRPPLASFEDWSRLVRSALCWLGCEDPCETMEMARAEDPELGTIRRMFAELRAAFPNRPATAGAIIDLAEHRLSGDYENPGPGKLAYPDLNDVLTEVAYQKGALSAKRLGWWLKRYKGRIVDNLRLEGTPNRMSQVEWLVRDINVTTKEPRETPHYESS